MPFKFKMEEFYITPLVQKLTFLKDEITKLPKVYQNNIIQSIISLNQAIDDSFNELHKNDRFVFRPMNFDAPPKVHDLNKSVRPYLIKDNFLNDEEFEEPKLPELKEKDLMHNEENIPEFKELAKNNIIFKDEIKDSSSEEEGETPNPNNFKRYGLLENPNYHIENFIDDSDSVDTKIRKLKRVKNSPNGLNKMPLPKTQRIRRNKIINATLKQLEKELKNHN